MPTLLYVYETAQGKLAVKLDYEITLKAPQTKETIKRKVNLVRSGTKIEHEKEWEKLRNGYKLIFGSLK